MAVGRLFTEIGQNIDRMNQSLRQMVTTAEDAKVKVTGSGQAMLSKFQDALNPAQKFREQLDLLSAAGAKQADVWKVYGTQLTQAADQTRKMGQSIDPAVQKMLDFGKTVKASGSGFESLGRTITDFARSPVATAQNAITGMLSSIGPVGVALGGIGTAAVAAGSYLVGMAKDAADTAEQLENLSIQTGLTTQDLQALQQIGKEKGVELDLAKQLGKLNKELADVKGTGSDFVRTLNALRYAQGLPAADLSSGLIPALVELRQRVLAIEDPFERAKAQSAALGKGFASLKPIIFDQNRSIGEMIEAMKKTDAVWGPEAQSKLMAFDDLLDTLGRTFKAIGNDIAIATVSAIQWTGVIEAAGTKLPTIQETYEAWAKSGKGLPQFDPSRFKLPIGVMEGGDPFKNIAAEMARLDAIAQGTKVAIDLQIKLKQAEEERAAAKKDNDVAEVARLTKEIAGIKERIAIEEEAAKKTKENNAELDKLFAKTSTWPEQIKRAEEHWLDVSAAYRASVQLQRELNEQLKEGAKEADALFFSMVESMEKANKEIVRSQIDAISNIDTKSFRKTQDELLRVNTETGSKVADVWQRQVSTIVTDFSRGFSEVIFAGKSFGESLKNIFIDIGKSIIRTLTEILFVPFERWLLRALTGAATVGTSAAGTGGGLSGLGGLALGGLGTLAGIAGTGGLAAGMMMPGGFGAKLGVGLGTSIFGGAGAISAGLIPGMGAATFGSALGYMSSGAWLPGIGVGGLLGMGAMTLPVLGAIAFGTYELIKAVRGPSTQQAGAKEVMRDLGIGVGKDTVKQFIGQFIDPEMAWGIRKDLLTSPAFLQQVALPIAQQQGTTGQLTSRLSKVAVDKAISPTGYLDFSAAFKTAMDTGDWSALNKQWVDAFEHSNELVKMLPDFATKLLATGDATSTLTDAASETTASMTALRDSIQGSITPVDDMYATFLKTGEITEEFRKQITDLGGDIAAFEDLAKLSKINNDFNAMVQHFRETGEILPGLRQAFIDFGGSLQALDDAAALPGLRSQLTFITDIQSRLQALSPVGSAIEKMFSGQWDQTMWGALTSQGLDPSKLTNFIDLTAFTKGWEPAVAQFQQTGKLPSLLEQGIWKYGGAEGMTALQNYQRGFNTITPGLLSNVSTSIQEAYNKAVTDALDYIGSVQQETSDKITTLTEAVEEQFTTVGQNITAALDQAKIDVVTVLNQILTKLGGTATVIPGGVPSGGSAEYNAWKKSPEVQASIAGIPASVWQEHGGMDAVLAAWFSQAQSGFVGKTPPWETWTWEGKIPHAQTGGLVRVHDEEAILDRDQTRNLLRLENQAPIIVINVNVPAIQITGPVMADDLPSRIEEAWNAMWERGGYARLRSAIQTGRV